MLAINLFLIPFLLGGLISVPQKHQIKVTTHYNSGFFITTNVFPDFGSRRDGDAIKTRLTIFDTRSLKSNDAKIGGEYCKSFADHCVIYAKANVNQW